MEAQEGMRGVELSFEKTPYFFCGSLFFTQIRGKELKGRAEQAGGASSGPHWGRLPLWSGAILTALTTVENLYSGCKQADGLKPNGGHLKMPQSVFLGSDTTAFWSYCFSEKFVSRGLAMSQPAISSCCCHCVKMS